MIEYFTNQAKMSKNKLTPKILLLLISTDILETVAQFCFKKSALSGSGIEIKSFSTLALFFKLNFFSLFLWSAFVAVFILFIIWSSVLSKIDLSIAVPIASFSYILVPLVSIVFLKEKVTWLRWGGIFFIILGVISVSFSSREKRDAHS